MKVQVATKLACDFCGKTQDEVAKLIAGPKSVCICNECVGLCVEILESDANKDGDPSDATADKNQ